MGEDHQAHQPALTVLLCYGNLNFGRAKDHGNDVARMRAEGADVIALVELDRPMQPPGFHAHQPDRWDRSVGSEGIYVDRRIPIESTGKQRAATNRLGRAIGWRSILTVVIEPPGMDLMAVVVVHMPPKRMWGPLYTAYAARLRATLRRLNRRGIPWVVAGDWNKYLRDDPADLGHTFRGRWYGERIDGWHVHPKLVDNVKGWHTWQPPGRNDSHPYCYLNLGPKK